MDVRLFGGRLLFFAVATLFLSAFLLAPRDGFTQEASRFRLGSLEIHPGVDVSVQRDNNIFKSNSSAKSDTILTYVPEINFDLKIPDSKESSITAGLKYEIIDFDKFGGEDVENLTAKGGLKLERIDGNVYSRTDAQWLDTSDASSSETQSTTGPRTPRTEGKIDTKLGVGGYDDERQSKSHLQVSAGLTRNRYDRAAQNRLENNETRGGVIAERAISPKTSLKLVYEFVRTRYINRASTAQNDDARSHSLRAGVSLHPTAMISGSATVGAVRKLFDRNDLNDGSSRDTTGVSADIDLTWEARPSKTKVNVTFTSGIENASSPGQFGFRNWKIGGKLTQGLFLISDNLELSFSPSISTDAFINDSSNRKDNLLTISTDIKYSSPSKRLPWFATVSYARESKTTNVNKSSTEYSQAEYGLKMGVVF